jgi:hypothetical protein
MAETAYKQHFRGMMAKHGYKHPGEIPDEEKKDFFKKVDRSWKAKDESYPMNRAEYILLLISEVLMAPATDIQSVDKEPKEKKMRG